MAGATLLSRLIPIWVGNGTGSTDGDKRLHRDARPLGKNAGVGAWGHASAIPAAALEHLVAREVGPSNGGNQ
jgi:hypothetical protein